MHLLKNLWWSRFDISQVPKLVVETCGKQTAFSAALNPPASLFIGACGYIGDSTLSVGMNDTTSLCVSPETEGRAAQGAPWCSPSVSWDRLQHPPPHDPEQEKRIIDGFHFQPIGAVCLIYSHHVCNCSLKCICHFLSITWRNCVFDFQCGQNTYIKCRTWRHPV